MYPTPGPDGAIDAAFLAHLRQIWPELRHLRINADCRNSQVDALVVAVQDAGFEPLVILDLDYDRLLRPRGVAIGTEWNWLPVELEPWLDFAEGLVRRHGLAWVEVLNEPWIMHAWPPALYAHVANAVALRLRETGVQIAVAGEMWIPDRKGPKYHTWWEVARRGLVDDLYDAVAVHPYREPAVPERTRYHDRRAEHQRQIEATMGKPILVTEVGWNLSSGIDEQQQADYLWREATIWRSVGVMGVWIYAHVSPQGQGFGLFDSEDWRARPAVAALRQALHVT